MLIEDKNIIFNTILEKLDEKLQILVESAMIAKEASTNEESKAENKYDTRGLEASYLAAGQAKRAQELQENIFQTKKVNLHDFSDGAGIRVSALIEVSINDESQKWFFILPVGGIEIEYKSLRIQSITLDSPIGRNLHNQGEGDDFVMNKNEYEILRVI